MDRLSEPARGWTRFPTECHHRVDIEAVARTVGLGAFAQVLAASAYLCSCRQQLAAGLVGWP